MNTFLAWLFLLTIWSVAFTVALGLLMCSIVIRAFQAMLGGG